MVKHKNFGVLGGDMRQIFMAESIKKDGNSVKIYGNSACATKSENLSTDKIDDVTEESDYIILPLPVTYDGKTLNTKFFDNKIDLDQNLLEKLSGKVVFCGGDNPIKSLIKDKYDITLKDYYAREDFEIFNAVPTAEGAINIAISAFPGTINSSKCLVVGFGRIGKVLSKILKNLGADVTISARNASDLAWIQVLGYKAINTNNMPANLEYDLIFNTVPFMIFDRENLLKCHYKTIIIDLSSKPGGVDFELAEFLGIKAIHALGLPGRFSPTRAGEIIKNTIYNIIEEERLWKK